MHIHCTDRYEQDRALRHRPERSAGEARTRWVVGLAAVTMVVEIGAGWIFNSMALLADGWHMASHAGALGLALAAYSFDRRQFGNARFTFGTGKVGALGGFASAIVLGLVSILMVWESAERLVDPRSIAFDQAMLVALVGLGVNLLSAWLLHDSAHHQSHGHGPDHAHGPHVHGQDHAHHRDHTVRAAYWHVVADALTSVLAVAALLCGKLLGWSWADAVMGIVGAIVIVRWAWGLARDCAAVLLDAAVTSDQERAIRAAIEADADNRVADLHVWCVRPGALMAIVSVVTHAPRPPDHYKGLLRDQPDLVHVTVEVHAAPGEPCLPLGTLR